ncbi:peptidase C14, caspase domain-containing protein [Ganoderma leucocontextum]|nr:peptidase C14, caspase domain-containing protein [Ganoderma leucocontextum]
MAVDVLGRPFSRTCPIPRRSPEVIVLASQSRTMSVVGQRFVPGCSTYQPEIHSPSDSTVPPQHALLIGVNYSDADPDSDYPPLRRPQEDTKDFRALLISRYDYSSEDIVMMLDDESLGSALQPTRANILREIQKLVGGARDGSSLIFFYSGHSGQVEGEIPNKHEEDDGLDEFIVPIDHDEPIRPNLSEDETGIGSRGKAIKKRMITDNKLRKMLVDSLPIGAQITAIFDSYHSGTLLDLDHYLCDNVYSPWTNKHKTTMSQGVPRKDGQRMNRSTSRLPRDPPAHRASPRSPLSREGSSADVRNVRIYSRQRVSSTEVEVTNTHVGVDDIDEGERPLQSGPTFIYARPRHVPSGIAPRTRSADSLVKDGNMFAGEHGFGGTGVVSISSCHGAQPTWEPKKGSFTQWLIDILRE